MSNVKKLSLQTEAGRLRANTAARLAAVCPLLVMAVYWYGPRPLVLCAVAVVTAVLCDVLAAGLRRRAWQPGDVSSPLFAVLLVCLMPASIPYAIVEQDFQYHLTELETLTAAYLNMKETGFVD